MSGVTANDLDEYKAVELASAHMSIHERFTVQCLIACRAFLRDEGIRASEFMRWDVDKIIEQVETRKQKRTLRAEQ